MYSIITRKLVLLPFVWYIFVSHSKFVLISYLSYLSYIFVSHSNTDITIINLKVFK